MLIKKKTSQLADGSEYFKVKSQPTKTETTLETVSDSPTFLDFRTLIKASYRHAAQYDLSFISLKAFTLNTFTNQKDLLSNYLV